MKCHPAPAEETIMPNIDDKIAVRDGTGIWKPAVVTLIKDDGFVATFVRNAGPDNISIRKGSAIAWRLADAPVPA